MDAATSRQRSQKLLNLRRCLPGRAFEQTVRCIELDNFGRRGLLLNQARGRPRNQAIVPGYEAHDRRSNGGKSFADITVSNCLQATPDGRGRNTRQNLLMQFADRRRDPAAQDQETRHSQ